MFWPKMGIIKFLKSSSYKEIAAFLLLLAFTCLLSLVCLCRWFIVAVLLVHVCMTPVIPVTIGSQQYPY
jgi:uncharacterized membrane protein